MNSVSSRLSLVSPDRLSHLTPGSIEPGSETETVRRESEYDPLMLPLLGEIARHWQRIHPGDLTAPEALRLLGVLTDISERIEGGR
ncbi:hypothetical protein GCM10010533_13730 [Mycolicibacterium pallens]